MKRSGVGNLGNQAVEGKGCSDQEEQRKFLRPWLSGKDSEHLGPRNHYVDRRA